MIEFSRQQRQALKKLLGRPPVYPANSPAESFLLRYVFLEALCRLVGKYYRERAGGRSKPGTRAPEAIQLNVVSRSFSHFGIRVPTERLTSLLDSSLDRRANKSARNLRNGIVHRWDENDVTEAVERHSRFVGIMDAVIDAIARRANGRVK
jgi:hypothetical protein